MTEAAALNPTIDSVPIVFVVNGLPCLQFIPARVFVRY